MVGLFVCIFILQSYCDPELVNCHQSVRDKGYYAHTKVELSWWMCKKNTHKQTRRTHAQMIHTEYAYSTFLQTSSTDNLLLQKVLLLFATLQ